MSRLEFTCCYSIPVYVFFASCSLPRTNDTPSRWEGYSIATNPGKQGRSFGAKVIRRKTKETSRRDEGDPFGFLVVSS
ncbi:MAG: hypothetical protein ACTHJ5_07920 [Ilyomonas sp.]